MMNDVNILYICIFYLVAINLVAFFILYNIHIQKCLAWVGVSGTECFAGVQGGPFVEYEVDGILEIKSN